MSSALPRCSSEHLRPWIHSRFPRTTNLRRERGSWGAVAQVIRARAHWLYSLMMKFIYAGKLIELTGERDKNMEQISPSQLCHLVHTGNTSTYFHIQLEPDTTTTLPSPCQIPLLPTPIIAFTSTILVKVIITCVSPPTLVDYHHDYYYYYHYFNHHHCTLIIQL